MSNDYKEIFDQIKIAGGLAAETLDEVTPFVKPFRYHQYEATVIKPASMHRASELYLNEL